MNKHISITFLVVIFVASCGPSNITTNIPSAFTPSPAPTTTPSYNNPLWYRYSSSFLEISFSIPEDWHVEETETGVTITSDPSLQIENNLSFANGDAIILLTVLRRESNLPFDGSTIVDMLINLPPYLPPGKEPAHLITVNGKRIAFAGYGINKPIPYPSFTAIIPLEEKAVLGLIFTSITNERSFREVFQNIMSSIESDKAP